MYQASEQLIALNKAQLEATARFASVALQGAERVLDVQIEAAKSAFADGIESAKALAAVKSVQDLTALKDNAAQPIEKATAYAKNLYDAALQTHSQFTTLLDEQVAQFNRQIITFLDGAAKDAPPGSDVAVAALKSGIAAANASYETLAKLARRFTETAQSNVEFVAAQTAAEARKSKKAA